MVLARGPEESRGEELFCGTCACEKARSLPSMVPDARHSRGVASRARESDPLDVQSRRRERREPSPFMFAEMLSVAVEHADGDDDRLFLPWGNSRRDIRRACELAQIPPCSWNDLRRTFASMLVQAGADNAHTARALGHSTSAMVDRVYGRHSPNSLGDLLATSIAGATALPGVH